MSKRIATSEFIKIGRLTFKRIGVRRNGFPYLNIGIDGYLDDDLLEPAELRRIRRMINYVLNDRKPKARKRGAR